MRSFGNFFIRVYVNAPIIDSGVSHLLGRVRWEALSSRYCAVTVDDCAENE